VALKELVVYGGGSEKSLFSLPGVQSDVLLPSHMLVTTFSTDQQCLQENALCFISVTAI